ncbi:MAG: MBL fold metallo-hydrolase [Ktedonobacterales bacterium]
MQADHLSGAKALAERTGAPIYLHEAADVAFAHRTLRDGDELELGNDYLRVLHTPGHSPDSMCLLVGDRTRGSDPWFLLTGDTLFVGDAGRPDLTASDVSEHQSAMDTSAMQAARALSGLLADRFGVPWAITAIAAITFASGALVLIRMRETLHKRRTAVVSALPQPRR